MALRAVTLLGENTVPILADLCRHLTATTGIEIEPDPRPPPASVDAADRAAGADLIWGCGSLMCDLVDSGRLDAEIVAAPVFEGETGPVYHSVIVAADPSIRSVDDARGSRLAINEPESWSGHLALVRHLASLDRDVSMFVDIVKTGSHRSSIDAVAAGEADVASIDHTVWEHLGQGGRVRAVERTQDWPAPPFAFHERVGPSERGALIAALTVLRPAMGLDRVALVSRSSYSVMRGSGSV